MELFVIGLEDAEVVHIARGYVDADPEVYKNPLQEHDVRQYIDAVCQLPLSSSLHPLSASATSLR